LSEAQKKCDTHFGSPDVSIAPSSAQALFASILQPLVLNA
jgi:hypothetical protein